MAKRPYIVGNWKMHGTRAMLSEARAIDRAAERLMKVEVALAPPFTLIHAVRKEAGLIGVGAQDCHVAEAGAHTGDVSAVLIKDSGAGFVIVGHSERRADQHETSHDAWAKAASAHRQGLRVILCCGETEAERNADRAERVVQAQIEKSVPDNADGSWFTLAYEPRWAIGTGRTPTLDEIAAIHAIARAKLRMLIGDAAAGVRILYGGSVTGANAEAILSTANVDGALVGGASLTAALFVPIIEATARV